MKKIILFPFFCLIISCTLKENTPSYCNNYNQDFGCEVPFYALIAVPKAYDERKITTQGFLVINNGYIYLIADIDGWKHPESNVINQINIGVSNYTESEFVEFGNYIVTGYFDYENLKITKAEISFLPPLYRGEKIEIKKSDQ